MSYSRRRFLQASGGFAGVAGLSSLGCQGGELEEAQQSKEEDLPQAILDLEKPADDIAPISLDERRARIERAKVLMAAEKLDAVVIAGGTTMRYFTGARWGTSERFFGTVLTKEGDLAWVTPAFEEGRAREQIEIGTDIRAWQEHESPYALVASILRDRGVGGGRIGIEETMPFVFADGIGAAAPSASIVSGTPVTAGCRMIKDAHELEILRRANQNTMVAHRAVFQSLKVGMTQGDVSALSSAAHRRMGMRGGALVLFGKDAAYPHGTADPQPLQEGEFVLIDGGGSFLDYSSDISRTGMFGGTVTDRQRRVWDVVKEAQKAAFDVARPGVECQALDAAARKVIEDAGFGSDYQALTHRVGHGIGMNGHEWTYLVRNNTTKLQPGMCFSDEPGIYILGELGVRHEDIIYITEDGAANTTKWTGSPEDPAVI